MYEYQRRLLNEASRYAAITQPDVLDEGFIRDALSKFFTFLSQAAAKRIYRMLSPLKGQKVSVDQFLAAKVIDLSPTAKDFLKNAVAVFNAGAGETDFIKKVSPMILGVFSLKSMKECFDMNEEQVLNEFLNRQNFAALQNFVTSHLAGHSHHYGHTAKELGSPDEALMKSIEGNHVFDAIHSLLHGEFFSAHVFLGVIALVGFYLLMKPAGELVGQGVTQAATALIGLQVKGKMTPSGLAAHAKSEASKIAREVFMLSKTHTKA
jgi:hypothetical protein